LTPVIGEAPLELPRDPERAPTPVDPAGIDSSDIVSVTIDITRLLREQAGEGGTLDSEKLQSLGELAESPSLTPMLGLISRSVASALGSLEVTHFRALVLLSDRDSLIAAELMGMMNMPSGQLLALLDAMDDAGWISTRMRGRGVNETVAITEKGRAVVEEVTTQRQNEIDEILARMTGPGRDSVSAAFAAFVSAAGESPVRKPKKGIAP
jgi:DNA-binding MarR family transcriptional regulator